MMRTLKLIAVFLGLSLSVVACSDNVVGPENEPEVANATDTFQWQVSGLKSVSQTFTYTWKNTGTLADVDQSAAVSGGTAVLTVRDADGSQVYSRSLTEGGSAQTATGVAGDWTLVVKLSDLTGTLNFRVQKP